MSYDLEDIIEHYGVKGMKWGVRKDPDRVAARKQAKTEKKADKKWAKGMTKAKIHEAMTDADSRTKKQQEEALKKMTETDTYKKAQSGDRLATTQLNFDWTREYAKILNADMSKQAELKSPSGKKAIEVTLARMGDQPFMAPKIVDKEIEHYGVKGMKWGVRKAKTNTKTTLQKVGRALGKRNARKAAKQDAYHDKKMKSSKMYKLIYEGTPSMHSSKGRDRLRQKSAKAQYRSLQLNVATMVVGGALAAASSKKGQKAISTVSNFVISGDAQKLGKNVLNTITGSPLRYVNAENMKNVVVDSGALGGR